MPSLVVMVDEMDKIEDSGDRTTAVNHIKDLFRIDHVKFLITIADDHHPYRFMRYGTPGRDRNPYDSAFDDIIEIRACDPLTAVQMFTRRVRGFPAPLALLVFIVAAGHPRDMIRVARSALDKFRQAEARISDVEDEPAVCRMRALEEAIDMVCLHEDREFSALLAVTQVSGRFGSTSPWDSAGDAFIGSPEARKVKEQMSDALEQARAFARDYANDPDKGWATPDLAGPDIDPTTDDELWKAFSDCRRAADLATLRLEAVHAARQLCTETTTELTPRPEAARPHL